MKVLTYNIRHGVGMDQKLNLQRIADTIAAAGADLVGLQEVDRFWSERSNWEDQIQILANELRMHYVYLPALDLEPIQPGGNRRQYGLAVLSRYPVLETVNRLLTSEREQRGLMQVTVDIYSSKPVHFFNTHCGLSAAERKKQTAEIIQYVQKQQSGPSIIVGDFNADLHSEEMQQIAGCFHEVLSGQPDALTFPSNQPKVKLDHIFYTDGLALQDAQIIQTEASDHLPIVAQFQLQ